MGQVTMRTSSKPRCEGGLGEVAGLARVAADDRVGADDDDETAARCRHGELL